MLMRVELLINMGFEEPLSDFEVFEKQIVDHDVKMFILCNPHNPIGKVWTKEELLIVPEVPDMPGNLRVLKIQKGSIDQKILKLYAKDSRKS